METETGKKVVANMEVNEHRYRCNFTGLPARNLATRYASGLSELARLFVFGICIILIAFPIASCSREDSKLTTGNTIDYKQVALEFTKLLAAREYAKAYSLTAMEYRQKNTLEQLKENFERIVPVDFGPIGTIETGLTNSFFREKRPSDLAWVYVSIGGDVYSEALTVIVTLENEAAKIREIEFGRP
jgi:hypothetical protein